MPPADTTLLNGAAATLRRRLSASAMFAQVTVEKTQDPERLLVAAVRYRPGTALARVCSHLEAIWVSELCLPGLDAFNFLTEDRHIEFESFTGDKTSGYYLTLHLMADEGQAEDFEKPTLLDGPGGRKPKKRWLRR